MAKNRDFIDYMSLGNQLLQTSRLGDIQQAQAALVALEAERVQLEERKANALYQEDKIREYVFGCSKVLEGLEAEYAESKAAATLVLLYGLERNIESLGISTHRVRSYEDKEKVHQFVARVKLVIANCEQRLDAKAVADAKACAKYRAENDLLETLIEFEQAQLNLQRRQEQIGKMGTPGNVHHIRHAISLPVLTIGGLMIAFAAVSNGERVPAPMWVSIVGWLLALLGGWGALPKGKNKALHALEKLEGMKGRFAFKFPPGLIEKGRRDLGRGDLNFYKKLQTDRAAFMRETLGDDLGSG